MQSPLPTPIPYTRTLGSTSPKEPWVFSIPDMGDRYYLLPMLDGWTDVFQVPGKRTTGDKAQKYAITGPGWSGTLPAGVTEYKSPTAHGVAPRSNLLHRNARRLRCRCMLLQDKFSLVPLSSYGKPYTPLRRAGRPQRRHEDCDARPG